MGRPGSMDPDLTAWAGPPEPAPVTLEGRYARLEPLAPAHADDLFDAVADHPELYRYLHEHPPRTQADMAEWVARTVVRRDLLMWAVLDRATGRAGGRQALMRIDAANGVVEVGSILWGPAVAGTRIATEALALQAAHVFDDLGYRRLEWKCDSANAASRAAAARFGFGFEGLFAQHQVVKGRNRDTAWFALLDHQWPAARARLDAWLDPDNFDDEGRQRTRLART